MATDSEPKMDQSLEEKVVLITGGRRVAGDLAVLMAAEGWRIAMTYHTGRTAIERTIESVEKAGTAGLAIAANLARPEQAENAISQVVTRFGRLDALVNMASVYRRMLLAIFVRATSTTWSLTTWPHLIIRPLPRPARC